MGAKVFLLKDEGALAGGRDAIRNMGNNGKLYLINKEKYLLAMDKAAKILQGDSDKNKENATPTMPNRNGK